MIRTLSIHVEDLAGERGHVIDVATTYVLVEVYVDGTRTSHGGWLSVCCTNRATSRPSMSTAAAMVIDCERIHYFGEVCSACGRYTPERGR